MHETVQIVTTALPAGYTAGGTRLKVSVLINPRLVTRSDATTQLLADFPDFVDWPSRLRATNTRVELSFGRLDAQGGLGSPLIATSIGADARAAAVDSATWKALLPAGDTRVAGFSYTDYSHAYVLSYPTAQLSDYVRSLYGGVAAQYATNPPTRDRLLYNILLGRPQEGNDPQAAMFPPVGKLVLSEMRDALISPEKALSILKDSQGGRAATMTEAFRRFQVYHLPLQRTKQRVQPPADGKGQPARWSTYEQTLNPRNAKERSELAERARQAHQEFHAAITAANRHGWLQRRLGLVLDLELPEAKGMEIEALARQGAVWVRARLMVDWSWPRHNMAADGEQVTLPELCPATVVTVDRDRGRFIAASRPHSALVNRLLTLDDATRYGILTVDLDGACMKIKNQAFGLALLQGQETDHDSDTAADTATPLSSLRSGGLTVAHFDRDLHIKSTLGQVSDLFAQAGGVVWGKDLPIPLYADDLAKGLAFDIMDGDRPWQSLCRRLSSYALQGIPPLPPIEDEMAVQLAMTTSSDSSNTDVLKLSEALCVWKGWSLAVRSPGGSLAADDSDPRSVVSAPEASDSELGNRLAARIVEVPPASLPSLRFGRTYRARARVVDLANNARPYGPSDISIEGATAPQVYPRCEPIAPPSIVLPEGRATSVDGGKLWQLADFDGESMHRLAIRTLDAKPQPPPPADPLAATETTPKLAERLIAPPRVAVDFAELHGVLDEHAGKLDGRDEIWQLLVGTDKGFTERKVASKQGGSIVTAVYQEARRGDEVPYLPDPLAYSLTAILYDPRAPGRNEIVIDNISYYKDGKYWPHATLVSLVLLSGSAVTMVFNAGENSLVVTLPPGEMRRLRLSHNFKFRHGEAWLELMAVWRWAADLAVADKDRALLAKWLAISRAFALAGRHEMLTPSRELTLVHAVQRPLVKPVPALQPIAGRDLASTFARPGMTIPLNMQSTAKLDVYASWNLPVDAASRDGTPDNGPRNVATSSHACEIKISRAVPKGGTLSLTANDRINYELGLPVAAGDTKKLDVALVKSGSGSSDQDWGLVPKHELGDTRYRQVAYQVVAASRYREYLPDGIRADDTKVRLSSPAPSSSPSTVPATVTCWVPNAAPPPLPDVAYVVPTFGWQRGDSVSLHVSLRKGGGLRVFLNRPWLVTGYHEMLGVLLPPSTGDGDQLEPYVTRWGADPAVTSPPPPTRSPQLEDFTARITRTPIDKSLLPDFMLPSGVKLQDVENLPELPQLPVQKLRLPTGAGKPADIEVDVAPHYVRYDAERKLWYCDIVIEPGAAYYPFVRLALARYHPLSVENAHLSGVVRADFAQLAPDRWVVVASDPAKPTTRRVSVFGHAALQRAPFVPSPFGIVTAVLQEAIPGTGDDFGWVPVSGSPLLTSYGPVDIGPASGASTSVPATGITPHSAALITMQVGFPAAGRSVTHASAISSAIAPIESQLGTHVGSQPSPVALLNLPLPDKQAMALMDQTIELPASTGSGRNYRLLVQEWEYWGADAPEIGQPVYLGETPRCVFAETVPILG